MKSHKHFDFSYKNKNFDLYSSNSFTSNTQHSKVKHCVEVTFLGGTKKFKVGFSNAYKSSLYAGYLGEGRSEGNTDSHLIYYGTSESYKVINIRPIIDQSILVCCDTEAKTVTDSYEFTVEDKKTWHVLVSGNSYTDTAKISLNLGFKAFNNTLPSGYLPWIVDVDSVRYNNRKCTQQYNSFAPASMLLIMIIMIK